MFLIHVTTENPKFSQVMSSGLSRTLSCLFFLLNFTLLRSVLLGIDIGDDNIKVATVSYGRGVQIFLDGSSKRKIPSLVYFEKNERHFGNQAVSHAIKNPQNSISRFKSLLAFSKEIETDYFRLKKSLEKNFVFSSHHDEIEEELKPLEKTARISKNGEKKDNTEERNKTKDIGAKNNSFEKFFPRKFFKVDLDTGKQSLSPEEVLGMLLQQIYSLVEQSFKAPAKKATLTVPTFFTQNQRLSVIRAAKAAGFSKVFLIGENIAAAIQYSSTIKKNINKTIAIINVGYSKTEVSVIRFEYQKKEMFKEKKKVETNKKTEKKEKEKKNEKKGKEKINEKSEKKKTNEKSKNESKKSEKKKIKEIKRITELNYTFDSSLGGKDFDRVLTKYLIKQFVTQNKISGKRLERFLADTRALTKIRFAAEKAKRILSVNKVTTVNIQNLYEGIDFFNTVKLDVFENLIAPTVSRISKLVFSVSRDFEEFILIGGSSRVPLVRKEINAILKLFFRKKKKELKTLNADEAPALGAVLSISNRSTAYRLKSFKLQQRYWHTAEITLSPLGEGSPHGVSTTEIISKGEFLDQKKYVSFDLDYDVSVKVAYHGAERLPKGQNNTILEFKTSSIAEFAAKKREEKRKKGESTTEMPTLRLIFNLDSNGVLSLSEAKVFFASEEKEMRRKVAAGKKKIKKLKFTEKKEAEEALKRAKKAEKEKIKQKRKEKKAEKERMKKEKKVNEEKMEKTDTEKQAEEAKRTEKKIKDQQKEKSESPKKDKKEDRKSQKKSKNKEGSWKDLDDILSKVEKKKTESEELREALESLMKETVKEVETTGIGEHEDQHILMNTRRILKKFTKRDEETALTAKKLNELEEMLYHLNELIGSSLFGKATTDDEKTQTQETYNRFRSWLDGILESKTQTASKTISEKISSLENATESVISRVTDIVEFPKVAQHANEVITLAAKVVNETLENKKWIPFEEVIAFHNQTKNFTQWINAEILRRNESIPRADPQVTAKAALARVEQIRKRAVEFRNREEVKIPKSTWEDSTNSTRKKSAWKARRNRARQRRRKRLQKEKVNQKGFFRNLISGFKNRKKAEKEAEEPTKKPSEKERGEEKAEDQKSAEKSFEKGEDTRGGSDEEERKSAKQEDIKKRINDAFTKNGVFGDKKFEEFKKKIDDLNKSGDLEDHFRPDHVFGKSEL